MKERAKQLRKNRTDAENRMWYFLRNRRLCGYKFVREHVIGHYIADFVCREKKLIIEVDGGQHMAAVDYDIGRTKALGAHGYQLLRVWNREVFENIDGVMQGILCLLEAPPSSPAGDACLFREKLAIPGEHLFFIAGQAGQLEVALTVPEARDGRYIALLGHPHSLQGGTMSNKVVTTLVRAFKELNIASLRFNFRGVGLSAGVYDDGLGESEDMLHLARLWLAEMPETQLLYAGFSFGSYVAYRAAAQSPHGLLITIAPSVLHYDYAEFLKAPSPWKILQGDADDVVPLQSVINFSEHATPPIPLLRFSETGHFFHGKLIELKARLMALISRELRIK